MEPHQYSKRILIAVSGMSPQIITETVYALSQQEVTFIPTEIHIITTKQGAEEAKLNLLRPNITNTEGWFYILCKELALPEIDFSDHHIHVIEDENNQPLDDIRTPQQNEAAATYIMEFIRQKSADKEAALHVSIAGGRKTMGYYMGYALSLFGRDQDRLSHVLVSEEYEGNPHFYFPTKKQIAIKTREGKTLDPTKAKVTLADIPFLRVNNDQAKNTMAGFSFRETIQLTQEKLKPASLIIDKDTGQILANHHLLRLTNQEFVFYCWVVQKQLGGEPLISPTDETKHQYAIEFLDLYQALGLEVTASTEQSFKDGMTKDYIYGSVADIKKTIEKQLGSVSDPFIIENKTGRPATYMLGVDKEYIRYQAIEL